MPFELGGWFSRVVVPKLYRLRAFAVQVAWPSLYGAIKLVVTGFRDLGRLVGRFFADTWHFVMTPVAGSVAASLKTRDTAMSGIITGSAVGYASLVLEMANSASTWLAGPGTSIIPPEWSPRILWVLGTTTLSLQLALRFVRGAPRLPASTADALPTTIAAPEPLLTPDSHDTGPK